MKRIEQALKKCVQPDVAELLKSYLTEQYAKSARKGGFKLSDFCSKDKYREVLHGIYHKNGYKIATDAHILAVIKESYPDEWEGKIIHAKNGTDIEGKFSNYNAVRPKIETQGYREVELPTLDVKDLTVKLKLAKNTEHYSSYHIEVEGVYFSIELLLRFYPIISRIGGKMYLSDSTRPMYIVNESDEWAVLMPINGSEPDTFLVKWGE